MIPTNIEQIQKKDIDVLLQDQVREGRDLEYKLTLPGRGSDDRKEFVADISSFANAAGGDLVFGVEAKDGTPISLPGLSGFKPDGGTLALEQMIRDGVDPRIPGIRFRAVEGFAQGSVLVVRIPKSWASPHMVKSSSRFFSRTSAGKYPLDVREIRELFEGAAGLPDRIRRWRDDRLGRILAGQAPVPLRDSAKIVLHAVPLSSFTNELRFPASDLMRYSHKFQPLCADAGWNPSVNFDGVLNHVGPIQDDGFFVAYCQAFRSGRFESVYSCFAYEDDKPNHSLYLPQVEVGVWQALGFYFEAVVGLQIELPIMISLAILGARGTRLGGEMWAGLRRMPLDRDVLVLPEAMIEEPEAQLEDALRPLFDSMWNAFGVAASQSYDAQGKWNPR